MRRGRLSPAVSAPLDLAGVQIPWHFRCPISLELMRDPVTVSTGQTYDRASIESWLAMGNSTCPVTRVPLAGSTLIPNHTLRRLIQDWCVAHRSLGVERIPTPRQPVDPAAVRALLAQAATDAPSDARVAALRRLRSLARESEKDRSAVSTREAREALVEIAFAGPPDVAAAALEAVAALPPAETAVAARPERVARLAAVLGGHQSIEARIGAAALVEGMRPAEVRDGVVEGMVALVDERGNSRAVRAGVRGLLSLCLAKENRGKAVAAGAAEAVLGHGGNGRGREEGGLGEDAGDGGASVQGGRREGGGGTGTGFGSGDREGHDREGDGEGGGARGRGAGSSAGRLRGNAEGSRGRRSPPAAASHGAERLLREG